jgi:hypothetical protein
VHPTLQLCWRNPHARLITLTARGGTHLHLRSICKGENNTSMFLNNDQVTVAYTSVNKHTVRPAVDIGFASNPQSSMQVSATRGRTSLRLCEKRKFLFSFQGRDVSFCIRVLLPACIATLFLSHCSNCSLICYGRCMVERNSFGIRKNTVVHTSNI